MEGLAKMAAELDGKDYAILDKVNTSPGILKKGLVFGGVDSLIRKKFVAKAIDNYLNLEVLFLTPKGTELLSFVEADKKLKAKLTREAIEAYLDFREKADLGKNLRAALRRKALAADSE